MKYTLRVPAIYPTNDGRWDLHYMSIPMPGPGLESSPETVFQALDIVRKYGGKVERILVVEVESETEEADSNDR